MTKQYTLFNLFGFEVRLHGSWIFLALLVGWSLAAGYFPNIEEGLSTSTYWIMGLIGVIGLFFSIVFHEFFHSVVARYFDMPMKGITLFIFGGIAEMADEPPNPKAEGFMAIAGPISSLVLFFAFGGVAVLANQQGWSSPVSAVLEYLSQINLILAVFNMVPAFPLDGGRVLRSILWSVKGDIRWATRWASRLGTFFGFLLIVLGVISMFGGQFIGGLWWILIGFFLTHIAGASYSQLIIKQTLKGEPLKRFVTSEDAIQLQKQLSVEIVVNEYFYRYRQRLFPVVEDGRLIGCLNIEDVRKIPPAQREETRVEEAMHSCLKEEIISVDESAYEAFKRMIREKRQELVVLENDRFHGTLKRNELLKTLAIKMEIEENQRIPVLGT